MLEMININKTFDAGTTYSKKVIDDLNLKVNDEDFICIIGANGSGKSTLFSLIAGSILSDSGKIILDGKNITMDAEYKRAHYIGRLFQDPMLGTAPDLTVYENLMLAAKQGSWLSIPDKSDRRYLQERLRELDMGLEDRMNTPVRLLSGGQRQALTLIMATINPPKILLLDEHTAALDPESADKVIDLTEKIVAENKITCLMITHNMQQALQLGNRTIMLNSGKIVYEAEGEERKKLTVSDLISKFKNAVGKDLDNDEMLLNINELQS